MLLEGFKVHVFKMQRKSIIKFYAIANSECYFVFCAVSNECLIISCGAWLSANGLTSSSCLYSFFNINIADITKNVFNVVLS
jgi:hypothetical protein